MTEEIKFPFEPNEKTKAAFRNDVKMKKAIQLMTESLTLVAAEQCGEPFDVAFKEHPELIKNEQALYYNFRTKQIDIKTKS